MSECSHVGPNGQKSILAQQLLDTYQDPAITSSIGVPTRGLYSGFAPVS